MLSILYTVSNSLVKWASLLYKNGYLHDTETRVPIDPKDLIELIDAALSADYTRVRRAANGTARALEKDGDIEAAKEVRAMVKKRGVPLRASGYMESLPVDTKSRLPLVEEQRLRIDGTDAADIMPLARAQIVDKKMITRIAHGIKQAALFIVQQAAAAFFRDQRVPPENLILPGVESEQGGAAETALRVMPRTPRRIHREIDRGSGEMRRHV